jgi:hypothetical protein
VWKLNYFFRFLEPELDVSPAAFPPATTAPSIAPLAAPATVPSRTSMIASFALARIPLADFCTDFNEEAGFLEALDPLPDFAFDVAADFVDDAAFEVPAAFLDVEDDLGADDDFDEAAVLAEAAGFDDVLAVPADFVEVEAFDDLVVFEPVVFDETAFALPAAADFLAGGADFDAGEVFAVDEAVLAAVDFAGAFFAPDDLADEDFCFVVAMFLLFIIRPQGLGL